MPKVKVEKLKETVATIKKRVGEFAKASTAPTSDLKLRSVKKKLRRAQRKLRSLNGKKLAALKARATKE
ncbi:MAG: hypothetical protein HYZ53_26695 [Planctomycetes bacterium]|nr:hypothetical protein [Planctomycetota bacterium]